MALQWHQPEGLLYVRACSDQGVFVVDRLISRSFLLLPDAVHEDWPVTSVTGLQERHAQACLDLMPEVVLLGTGSTQQFPSPAWTSLFLVRHIGCEVMSNAAAARTFNVLCQEGRRVLAAFVLT